MVSPSVNPGSNRETGMVSDLRELCLFCLGLLVTIAYIPGQIGAAVSTGWFALLIFLPLILCFYKINITKFHLFGFMFLVYCVLSLLWTANFNIGLFDLMQLLALACSFCLGSVLRERELKFVIFGVSIGIGASAILAIGQYLFDWQFVVRFNHGIAGLFVNQNLFCEASAILFIVLCVYKLWFWLPVTLPGLILVHSRAALLSLLVCGLVYLWGRSKFAVSILASGGILAIPFFLKNGIDTSSIQRFELWYDTIRGFKFFGNGVGSYEILYPLYAVMVDTITERPKYAHNDWLQLIFEFGLGVLLLLPIIWRILISNKNERYIIYAIGIVACFSFPLHVPICGLLGCLFAGYLISFDDPNWNSRFYRRSILFERAKKGKFIKSKISFIDFSISERHFVR